MVRYASGEGYSLRRKGKIEEGEGENPTSIAKGSFPNVTSSLLLKTG